MNLSAKSIITALSLLAASVTQAAGSGGVRPQHYVPDGGSAVAVDGTARFNRALYGAHSGFRMECSDTPSSAYIFPTWAVISA